MKKILVWLYLCFMASTALADSIVLDNETNYPEKGKPGKIAVQWAATVEITQKANKTIIHGSTLDLSALMMLPQKGQIRLTPPNHSKYFRILVWSTDKHGPDFLTNWVNIVPNTTYTVKQDQLIPVVLMSGSGC